MRSPLRLALKGGVLWVWGYRHRIYLWVIHEIRFPFLLCTKKRVVLEVTQV